MSKIERFEVELETLQRKALVSVYLPEGYETKREWKVIYMCDGQNIFEDTYASYGRAWRLHEKHLDCVIIGVSCADGAARLDEYSPYPGTLKEPFDGRMVVGGKGDLYLKWLLEFKKAMEARYAITSKATIAGSSMGGVFSLYAWLKAKEDFTHAMCFSNAFYLCEPDLLHAIDTYGVGEDQTIYLDIGLKEVGIQKDPNIYVMTNRRIFEKLMPMGIRACYLEDAQGRHNEEAWDRRFMPAYTFIYDEKKD